MNHFCRNLLLILATFVAFTAKGQTANFTASVTSGCAPLVVSFTNTSSPGAVSYDWDFGDGFHSTLPSPGTSYLTAGTYTVTLRVTYPGGVVVTHTTTITVYPLPIVSFTVPTTTICVGMPLTFTSTTIGGVPGPITYAWDFGDGGTGTGATPTHTYVTPGTYNIILVATNAQGCQATLTRMAYINVVNGPTASFSATTTAFCGAVGTTTFTAFATGTAPFTYSWDFGDGGTGTGISPTHTYTGLGSYTVKLTVTDASGCSATVIMTNYITLETLTADFTSVSTACVNTPVTFTDISGAHTSASWTYGDGGSSTGDPGSHTYTAAGTYTVTLTVTHGPCIAAARHIITIVPAPVASFTITPVHPCPAPVTLTFAGSAPAGCAVTWTFGDGGVGSGVSTSHTYMTNNIFNITMKVVDPATGCQSIITRADTIYDLFLTVTANPTRGCKPLLVNFTADARTHGPYTGGTFPYPYGPGSYSWNYGDGGTGAGGGPSHTYTASGTYTAIVTYISANGCVVTDSVKIHVGQPPVVTFSATPTRACYHNNRIDFRATVISGPVDSFYWWFGDGSTAVDTSGREWHHYTLPGIFTITLVATYNGCKSVPVVLVNYITIDSPKAIMTYTVLCTPAGRVKFFDTSIGDDSREWLFGDGTTSTLKYPVHDYAPLTIYTVTLATYNSRSGCRDTVTQVIDLRRPVVTFSTPSTDVCHGSTVTITSTVTGGTASSYLWTSSGSPSGVGGATYSVVFATNGIYGITLVITDANGCPDTTTRAGYIRVAGPIVTFSATPTSGCWPLTVNFRDLSTDASYVSITGHSWFYGDGATGSTSLLTTVHTYTSAGTFATKEVVTDSWGCKDSATLSLITVYRPHANFTPSNPNPCTGDVVTFRNTSSSDVVSWFWWFGDGGTSTLASPTHAYSARGAYTVRLAVMDARGCTDTFVYNFINVRRPTATFTMSDSQSICPPLLVNFTNTTTGSIFGYAWTFGDGSGSFMVSPSHLYLRSGYDTVRLVVVDMFGCYDTAYAHVNLFGYAGGFSYTPDTGCAPLTVHFSAFVTNVTSIIWDFSDGYVSPPSRSDTITHVYTLPGAYIPKLVLSDNTGCQNSSLGIDTIKVDIVKTSFTHTPACIGSPFTFQDASTSYWKKVNQWLWTFTDGTTSNISNPTYTYSTVGTYTVTLTATDEWGCNATVVKDVVVNPLPDIDAGPDSTICLSDVATLFATGGVSYVWASTAPLTCNACNPAQSNPSVTSTYTVTGMDANGCYNSDTTHIIVKTTTEGHAWGDTEVCRGTVVQLHASGGSKYTWIPGTGINNAHVANPLANPFFTTEYMVVSKLGSCEPDTDYVRIFVHQLPTVDAGPDQNVLSGATAQIEATGTLIDKLIWKDARTLSCDACMNPVASMSVTTTYGIFVASDFGCKAHDSITIRIYCDKSQIFIPNAFTPNGDGQNDVFYPRGTGITQIKTFRIYNRWGQMLFERSNIDINDASQAWDGSYQADPPRPDVYVYVLEAICTTGEPINIKGDVTIIR